jgi:hypothetical protein
VRRALGFGRSVGRVFWRPRATAFVRKPASLISDEQRDLSQVRAVRERPGGRDDRFSQVAEAVHTRREGAFARMGEQAPFYHR